MTSETVLRDKVLRLQRRVRLLCLQRYATLGLLGGVAFATGMVAAARLRWWPGAVDWLWAALLAGLAAGILYGLTRRRSALAVAWLADQELGLKDRLSTGLEFSGERADEPVVQAMLADAAKHAERIDPARAFPWRAPREWRWLAGSAVLFLGLLILPDLPFFQSPEARAERAVMQEEGERLRELAKEIREEAKEDTPADELLRQIAREMERLGRDQERGRLTKKEAMLELSELMKELEAAQQELGLEGGQRTFGQMAQDLEASAQAARSQGRNQDAQALDNLARALRQGDMADAERQLNELAEQIRNTRDLERLRRDAELLESMASAMQGSEMASVADLLQQAAERLNTGALTLEQLERLAQAGELSPEELEELLERLEQQRQELTELTADEICEAGGT